MIDPAGIRSALDALRLRDGKLERFGAMEHGYLLQRPLPEPMIAEFEDKHRIQLPSEYRHFIGQIGNGGAGPYYGLFRLGEMDDGFAFSTWQDSQFVGKLCVPWPHRNRWNLSDAEFEAFDERWNALDGNADAQERATEEFDQRYWDCALVNGAIPICHHGCALRDWLVVTGPEAGQVWHDARVDNDGLSPCTLASGKRMGFVDWYLEWLNAELGNCGLPRIPNHRSRSVDSHQP